VAAAASTLRRPIQRIYTYSSSVRPSTEHATSAGCVAGPINICFFYGIIGGGTSKNILIYSSIAVGVLL